jgi:hypothetical protein
MKDIEKRLEAVCRQVGALWERGRRRGVISFGRAKSSQN